ncbi:hypothetical protein LCER1_G009375 [Lachnellula cervina]|uniref:2EXR domain-containing protein n=1 Tax=Lachnellula cervina TaxID=1316786 RepID=A0A7D8UJH1_9HELO|nr:hypothetical protein LCER1_G009375 [Lachnellula cervina]
MGSKKTTAKLPVPASKKSKKHSATKAKPKSKDLASTSTPSVTANDSVAVNSNASNQQNVRAGEEISTDEIITEFPQFTKLPVELRLKIWGYAAPEPMTVLQRPSRKSDGRFTYRRKPPAVLHACRESRLEYLDTGEGSESLSVARRRKEHPVYKLCFENEGLRCTPAYPGKSVKKARGGTQDGNTLIMGGIMELDIAKTVKHLAIKSTPCKNFGSFLRNGFPQLESFTILFGPWCYKGHMVPEVDGQMNVAGLDDGLGTRWRQVLQDYLDTERISHPQWTPPGLKIRFHEQFLANDNISP